jgi:hypothetical protein
MKPIEITAHSQAGHMTASRRRWFGRYPLGRQPRRAELSATRGPLADDDQNSEYDKMPEV